MTTSEDSPLHFSCKGCSSHVQRSGSNVSVQSRIEKNSLASKQNSAGLSQIRSKIGGLNTHVRRHSTSTDTSNAASRRALNKDELAHGIRRSRSDSSATFDELINRIRGIELSNSGRRASIDPPKMKREYDPADRAFVKPSQENYVAVYQQAAQHVPNVSSGQKTILPYRRTPSPQIRGLKLNLRQCSPVQCRIPSTKYEAEEEFLQPAQAKTLPSDSEPSICSLFSPTASVLHASWQNVTSVAHALDSKNLNEPRSSPSIFAAQYGAQKTFKYASPRKCPGCLSPVYFAEETLGPQGSYWHGKCLICTDCRKQLDSFAQLGPMNDESIDVHVRKVYCRACWKQRACVG